MSTSMAARYRRAIRLAPSPSTATQHGSRLGIPCRTQWRPQRPHSGLGSANILSSTFSIGRHRYDICACVAGQTYTILTTVGGLGNVTERGDCRLPVLNFVLSNDGFNAYLTTSRGAGPSPNWRRRATRGGGRTLDTAGVGSPLWQQVVGASEAQARVHQPRQCFHPCLPACCRRNRSICATR
jgi:hypothetical protein